MRPNLSRADVAGRIDALLPVLAAEGANLGATNGRQAADEGIELLCERGVLVEEPPRVRVRDRIVLRYYARTIEHLLHRPRRTTH
jgi:hypothetical protein